MATYTYNSSTTTRNSNASAEDFTFDISSAITAANIPAYAKITKVTINVWGDIDTATSRGKMTASFGSTSLCSSIWAGGSAGEVSSGAKEITSYFNSENANAGKLKDSSVRLNVTLDGPIMIAKFNHTVRYQVYFEWTVHSCSWNSGTVTKNATCTSAGTKTYTCTVCGATKTETIAQLSHSYTGAIKNDSNSKTGTHSYKCVNGCGNYGGAKTHTWNSGVQTTAPTCTANGVKTYTCTANGCGGTYTESISKLGHSWGTTSYTWSADGKSCTAKRVCSRCGTTETATATITSKVKIDATCTEKGTTTYTAIFGVSWAATQTKDVQDISANGHTKVTVPAVSPTCTEAGLTEGERCSVCGIILVAQTTVPATGHSYNSVVTQPTPTTAGYTTHTCSRCGHSYVDSYVYFPEFTSVSMTYLNKQISASNKVICNEGFIVSVGVT